MKLPKIQIYNKKKDIRALLILGVFLILVFGIKSCLKNNNEPTENKINSIEEEIE